MRVAASIVLLVLVACGGQEDASSAAASQSPETAVTTPNLTPEELGELGAKIRKEPARANELLSRRGLTHESFEKAIRDVTENAEASKRYAEAYKRAS